MSGVYAVVRQALVSGTFNWTTGSFMVCLVGAGYTPDYENDTTLANIPSGARLAALTAMTGLTAVAGYCRAANEDYASLTTTGPITGVVVLQANGGSQETYSLVTMIDQGDGFGQGATAQIAHIVWDSRGIFRP